MLDFGLKLGRACIADPRMRKLVTDGYEAARTEAARERLPDEPREAMRALDASGDALAKAFGIETPAPAPEPRTRGDERPKRRRRR